jgi:hypothetical protein
MIADVYEVTEPDEPLILEMRFRPHGLEPVDLTVYGADYKYLYSLQAETYADIVAEFHKAQGWIAEQHVPSISPPVGGDFAQPPFERILTWTVF